MKHLSPINRILSVELRGKWIYWRKGVRIDQAERINKSLHAQNFNVCDNRDQILTASESFYGQTESTQTTPGIQTLSFRVH